MQSIKYFVTVICLSFSSVAFAQNEAEASNDSIAVCNEYNPRENDKTVCLHTYNDWILQKYR
ncbi:MAG: hypothetical protein LBN18_00250 [Dysgonamonadaceae bacterium]|jgi:hypothetical protein|nr:hypothetical protein [Dysgonamonadaceae bacterium]